MDLACHLALVPHSTLVSCKTWLLLFCCSLNLVTVWYGCGSNVDAVWEYACKGLGVDVIGLKDICMDEDLIGGRLKDGSCNVVFYVC